MGRCSELCTNGPDSSTPPLAPVHLHHPNISILRTRTTKRTKRIASCDSSHGKLFNPRHPIVKKGNAEGFLQMFKRISSGFCVIRHDREGEPFTLTLRKINAVRWDSGGGNRIWYKARFFSGNATTQAGACRFARVLRTAPVDVGNADDRSMVDGYCVGLSHAKRLHLFRPRDQNELAAEILIHHVFYRGERCGTDDRSRGPKTVFTERRLTPN